MEIVTSRVLYALASIAANVSIDQVADRNIGRHFMVAKRIF